jgi:bis(5'-nucleosyl)-tetraphosphatase (symmetrical)
MPTYAIGDLQGCCSELHDLLGEIDFDPQKDRLWFTGDLVNRGPESLEALRFVKSLGACAITVLGNHDLHLLAVAAGHAQPRRKDTLEGIMTAPDRDELLDWLRRRPLLHRDAAAGFTLIHAGLPPQWSIGQAAAVASEVEQALSGSTAEAFYEHMYGDDPAEWSDSLKGAERLRFITNCFTRMRFCTPAGRISMREKGPPGSQPAPLLPWYAVPGRRSAPEPIIFGHWSTVRLRDTSAFSEWNVFPLDTGCIWGGRLTALRLDDRKSFSVPSRQPARFGD